VSIERAKFDRVAAMIERDSVAGKIPLRLTILLDF
jgi:hypothetical protein